MKQYITSARNNTFGPVVKNLACSQNFEHSTPQMNVESNSIHFVMITFFDMQVNQIRFFWGALDKFVPGGS